MPIIRVELRKTMDERNIHKNNERETKKGEKEQG